MLEGREGARYKFFWSGSEEGVSGVGILVAERWIESVIEVRRVSERLLVVRVAIGSSVLNVVCAYAPQVGRSHEEKEEFLVMFGKTLDGISEMERLVVGGDFNCHVGAAVEGYEGVHGGHGFGQRNVEGEMLLEMAGALGLVVVNTWFRKHDSQLVTYESGEARTVVDYVLVRRKEWAMVRDAKVIPGEPVFLQHRLVVCVLEVQECIRQRKQVFVSRCKVWRLREEGVRRRFGEQVEASAAGRKDSDSDVEGVWNGLKTCLLEVAEDVCGRTKGRSRHRETWWWNDEVANAVEVKRSLYRVWRKRKTRKSETVPRRREVGSPTAAPSTGSGGRERDRAHQVRQRLAHVLAGAIALQEIPVGDEHDAHLVDARAGVVEERERGERPRAQGRPVRVRVGRARRIDVRRIERLDHAGARAGREAERRDVHEVGVVREQPAVAGDERVVAGVVEDRIARVQGHVAADEDELVPQRDGTDLHLDDRPELRLTAEGRIVAPERLTQAERAVGERGERRRERLHVAEQAVEADEVVARPELQNRQWLDLDGPSEPPDGRAEARLERDSDAAVAPQRIGPVVEAISVAEGELVFETERVHARREDVRVDEPVARRQIIVRTGLGRRCSAGRGQHGDEGHRGNKALEGTAAEHRGRRVGAGNGGSGAGDDSTPRKA